MSNISQGWIAVDLDGTLAQYDNWKGPLHIGLPVVKMLIRVKSWLFQGKDVRIFTARVHPNSLSGNSVTLKETETAIENWCLEHLGQKLPITCCKDMRMSELWDDRCVQIIPNTGDRADGRYT